MEEKEPQNTVVIVDEMDDEELVNSAMVLEYPSTNSNPSVQSDNESLPIISSVSESRSGSSEDSITLSDSDFVCPFCNLQEQTLILLENHIAHAHPEFSTNESPAEYTATAASDNNVVALYNQKYQEFRAANLQGLDSSLVKTGDNADFTCPFCELNLQDAVSLYEHVTQIHTDHSTEHDGSEELFCPLCAFKCNFEHEMKDHVRDHENDDTYFGISTAGATGNDEAAKVTLKCPVCGLLEADPDLLTSHVETHFDSPSGPDAHQVLDKPSSSGIVSQSTQSPQSSSFHSETSYQVRGNYKEQHQRGLAKAFQKGKISVGEYHEEMSKLSRVGAKDVDDGQTRVQGLIEKIEALYRRQARAGQQVYLCAPTDHFSGSYGDKGWGCGYRNFQMMLSCLAKHPDYAARIFPRGQTAIPSVTKIQEMIEEAWRLGFDPQGSRQLDGKVVNTRKWIGATEIVATFSSLRIKCRLADFHVPSAPDGTHPRLLKWVSDYFCSNSDFKPPLYLQHQGHSRTIVGVEKEKGVTKLLLFDPGCSDMANIACSPLTWKHMKTFRRTQAGFKAQQYQVVAVVGLLTEQEYKESKVLQSERVS